MREPQKAICLPLREEAIAWTLSQAQAGDLVLLAGKGDETDQEIGGVRRPFDDREEARKVLQAKGWA